MPQRAGHLLGLQNSAAHYPDKSGVSQPSRKTLRPASAQATSRPPPGVQSDPASLSPRVQRRKGLARRPQWPNGEWEDQTHAHRWGGQGSAAVGGLRLSRIPFAVIFPRQLHPSTLQGHRGAWGKRLGQAGRGKMGMGPCICPHPPAISFAPKSRSCRRDSEGLHVVGLVLGNGEVAVELGGAVGEDLENDSVLPQMGKGDLPALAVADEELVPEVR